MGVFIMKNFIRVFDILFAFVCTIVFTFIIVGNSSMPDNIIVYDDNDNPFSSIYSYTDSSKIRSVDSQSDVPSKETLKLFGVVPVKEVTVTSKHSSRVFVSGEAFGIKLYTDGVIVVGVQSVDTGNETVNPAADAGIKVGDIIISINNIDVFTSDDVSSILNNNNGSEYKIKVKRDDRYKSFVVKPAFCDREGCYKAGLWVRDSTAGIGTITFYNKSTGVFGALGHQINDVDTKEIMPMLQGEAVMAKVTSVQKGSVGTTGSLVCDFKDESIGMLIENTSCGVFGAYSKISSCAKSYVVAGAQEIRKGRAELISTVNEDEPQKFDIEITRISYNSKGEKDIVFKVVDDDLIDATGGIVQGMSGSPIIQNNKLVGAVTHVVVSNPEKGYAIFAQTMLEESQK